MDPLEPVAIATRHDRRVTLLMGSLALAAGVILLFVRFVDTPALWHRYVLAGAIAAFGLYQVIEGLRPWDASPAVKVLRERPGEVVRLYAEPSGRGASFLKLGLADGTLLTALIPRGSEDETVQRLAASVPLAVIGPP